MAPPYPRLMHTALDAVDARALAEFYRQFLGLRYRPGDEPEVALDDDWLVLTDEAGRRALAVQREPELRATTWPSHVVPMQVHQDYAVGSRADLEHQRARAESFGATVRFDRTDDPDEPSYVMADPEGHPFCLLVVSDN